MLSIVLDPGQEGRQRRIGERVARCLMQNDWKHQKRHRKRQRLVCLLLEFVYGFGKKHRAEGGVEEILFLNHPIRPKSHFSSSSASLGSSGGVANSGCQPTTFRFDKM